MSESRSEARKPEPTGGIIEVTTNKLSRQRYVVYTYAEGLPQAHKRQVKDKTQKSKLLCTFFAVDPAWYKTGIVFADFDLLSI